MAELNPWWKTQAEFREKKAVVKLYREDKSFLTAVHIPSVYWPLSGPYEVFSYENTYCIEDEPKLVELFDSLEYKIGHCYHNTEQVAAAFRQAGQTIKTYCGWAFINDTVPIHHCWAVLTDECNHKAVLDLACDNHKMREWFWKKEQEDPGWLDQGDPKDNIVEWMIYARNNLSHSQRCYPCGVIPPYNLYIGAECEPKQGIKMYQKLLRENPGHLCERNCNADGYNRTQWALKQKGLMD